MAFFFVEENSIFRFDGPKKTRNLDKNLGKLFSLPKFAEKYSFFRFHGPKKTRNLDKNLGGLRISREIPQKCNHSGKPRTTKIAYFSRKSLGRMAGVRISREKAWVGWRGRVFLEKKLGMDGWIAYFSGKRVRAPAAEHTDNQKNQVRFFWSTFSLN